MGICIAEKRENNYPAIVYLDYLGRGVRSGKPQGKLFAETASCLGWSLGLRL